MLLSLQAFQFIPILSYIIASFNQRLFSKNQQQRNNDIKCANEILLFNRIESALGKWIVEKYKDKRDERVSGEMKGGNLAMIG